MIVVLLYFLLCMAGFILFANLQLDHGGKPAPKERVDKAGKTSAQPFVANRVSVIIPARNEESNLSYLLGSLKEQTIQPYEIIVVDDFSSDRTREIAEEYHVKVIPNPPLPEGWTGKNWAVWNGYLHSTGDILVFLDADVRLTPDALNSLLVTRERCGGAISVVPYHHTEKFYERLSLVLNILGVFAFTSPFERRSDSKGLYGSCIVAARADYEKIKGHGSVRSELLDDLNLGKRFSEAGIPVSNFIGVDLVSFRMYPNGLKSEIEGFGKGAVLSTSTLRPATVCLVAAWIIGLLTVGALTPIFLILRYPLAFWFLLGYFIFTAQVFYFARYTGSYGVLIPFLHLIPSVFLIYVMLYSLYRVTFVGSVPWKGRQINIGGRKGL